jgi:hypothetical protein
MIFGLEFVSALDLPQDAVLLFFFFEKAAQVEGHEGKCIGRASEEEVLRACGSGSV